MKPSEFKIFISGENYDGKYAENDPKCYVVSNSSTAHSFQNVKDTDPKFW